MRSIALPERRNRLVRIVLAVVLVASMTMGAASGCGNSGASSSSAKTAAGDGGMSAGEKKCARDMAAKPGTSCCTVGTSTPKAGMPSAGLVGAHVKASCPVVPEDYSLEVYLDWDLDGEGEYETVDQCSQYDATYLNQFCTVATSCKPGYYEVAWQMYLTIDGASTTEKESGVDYRQKVTAADCAATRHT